MTDPNLEDPAPPVSLDPLESFTDYIRECYPGGEHIAAHVHAGPFHIVPTFLLEGSSDIRYPLQRAIDTYPPIQMPVLDYDVVQDAHVFIVPKFVMELFYWYSDSDTSFYVIDEASRGLEFPNKPTEAELLRNLDAVLNLDLPGTTIQHIEQRVPFELLTGFLAKLDASTLDEDSYRDQVIAFAAAFEPMPGSAAS